MYERNAKIIQLYLAGNKISEIREQFSLSRQRIEQILKDSNVLKRKSKAKPRLTREERKTNKIARFWAKIDKSSENECWLWTKQITRNGYGLLSWESRITHAHRVSWELHNEKKTEYKLKHICKNRACCNPSHLEESSEKIQKRK
jgi:predicted DNA-binding protein YlxM (UPF0122 family)